MIVWTRSAVNDLDALRTIAELDPRSRGARRVIEAVSLLETTAHLGRPGRVKGTRELVLSGRDLPFLAQSPIAADNRARAAASANVSCATCAPACVKATCASDSSMTLPAPA